PEVRLLVTVAGDHRPPVWAIAHGLHRTRMPQGGESQGLAGGRLPEVCATVLAAGEGRSAVRAKGHAVDLVIVPERQTDRLSRGGTGGRLAATSHTRAGSAQPPVRINRPSGLTARA